MISSIFINLPISNLKRSIDFFSQLGFEFNAQFTDESGTCMIVNDKTFVMLLEQPKFQGFIDKPIAPATTTEVILSMQCESRDEVAAKAQKAFELGARKVNELEDNGFMVSWGFEDLDGHLWDLFWMNSEQVIGQEQ